MRRFLLRALVAVVAMIAWAVLVFIGTLNGWDEMLAQRGDADAFAAAAKKEVSEELRGNTGFRLIERGRLHAEQFVSSGEPVSGEAPFQVASLSKWIRRGQS